MKIDSPRITSFQPPARTLMGPGPSDVSSRVLAAMARRFFHGGATRSRHATAVVVALGSPVARRWIVC